MATSSILSCFGTFGRINHMKSRRFLVWSSLCETSTHLNKWKRSHFASCNNISHLTTSLKQNSRTYSESKQMKDQPISYSKSPAQNHKVDDTLQYDPRRLNSTRALVLCVGLFSSLIYFGFIRNETESESKILEWNQLEDNNTVDLAKQQTPRSDDGVEKDSKIK